MVEGKARNRNCAVRKNRQLRPLSLGRLSTTKDFITNWESKKIGRPSDPNTETWQRARKHFLRAGLGRAGTKRTHTRQLGQLQVTSKHSQIRDDICAPFGNASATASPAPQFSHAHLETGW